jgi:hypothetical protein
VCRASCGFPCGQRIVTTCGFAAEDEEFCPVQLFGASGCRALASKPDSRVFKFGKSRSQIACVGPVSKVKIQRFALLACSPHPGGEGDTSQLEVLCPGIH